MLSDFKKRRGICYSLDKQHEEKDSNVHVLGSHYEMRNPYSNRLKAHRVKNVPL